LQAQQGLLNSALSRCPGRARSMRNLGKQNSLIHVIFLTVDFVSAYSQNYQILIAEIESSGRLL